MKRLEQILHDAIDGVFSFLVTYSNNEDNSGISTKVYTADVCTGVDVTVIARSNLTMKSQVARFLADGLGQCITSNHDALSCLIQLPVNIANGGRSLYMAGALSSHATESDQFSVLVYREDDGTYGCALFYHRDADISYIRSIIDRFGSEEKTNQFDDEPSADYIGAEVNLTEEEIAANPDRGLKEELTFGNNIVERRKPLDEMYPKTEPVPPDTDGNNDNVRKAVYSDFIEQTAKELMSGKTYLISTIANNEDPDLVPEYLLVLHDFNQLRVHFVNRSKVYSFFKDCLTGSCIGVHLKNNELYLTPVINDVVHTARAFYGSTKDASESWAKSVLLDFITPEKYENNLYCINTVGLSYTTANNVVNGWNADNIHILHDYIEANMVCHANQLLATLNQDIFENAVLFVNAVNDVEFKFPNSNFAIDSHDPSVWQFSLTHVEGNNYILKTMKYGCEPVEQILVDVAKTPIKVISPTKDHETHALRQEIEKLITPAVANNREFYTIVQLPLEESFDIRDTKLITQASLELATPVTWDDIEEETPKLFPSAPVAIEALEDVGTPICLNCVYYNVSGEMTANLIIAFTSRQGGTVEEGYLVFPSIDKAEHFTKNVDVAFLREPINSKVFAIFSKENGYVVTGPFDHFPTKEEYSAAFAKPCHIAYQSGHRLPADQGRIGADTVIHNHGMLSVAVAKQPIIEDRPVFNKAYRIDRPRTTEDNATLNHELLIFVKGEFYEKIAAAWYNPDLVKYLPLLSASYTPTNFRKPVTEIWQIDKLTTYANSSKGAVLVNPATNQKITAIISDISSSNNSQNTRLYNSHKEFVGNNTDLPSVYAIEPLENVQMPLVQTLDENAVVMVSGFRSMSQHIFVSEECFDYLWNQRRELDVLKMTFAEDDEQDEVVRYITCSNWSINGRFDDRAIGVNIRIGDRLSRATVSIIGSKAYFNTSYYKACEGEFSQELGTCVKTTKYEPLAKKEVSPSVLNDCAFSELQGILDEVITTRTDIPYPESATIFHKELLITFNTLHGRQKLANVLEAFVTRDGSWVKVLQTDDAVYMYGRCDMREYETVAPKIFQDNTGNVQYYFSKAAEDVIYRQSDGVAIAPIYRLGLSLPTGMDYDCLLYSTANDKPVIGYIVKCSKKAVS